MWARSKLGLLTFPPKEILPECPCGGEIKTEFAGSVANVTHYQSALVGARSKLNMLRMTDSPLITRVPLWGRDQNMVPMGSAALAQLPECPCGGEIKTC